MREMNVGSFLCSFSESDASRVWPQFHTCLNNLVAALAFDVGKIQFRKFFNSRKLLSQTLMLGEERGGHFDFLPWFLNGYKKCMYLGTQLVHNPLINFFITMSSLWKLKLCLLRSCHGLTPPWSALLRIAEEHSVKETMQNSIFTKSHQSRTQDLPLQVLWQQNTTPQGVQLGMLVERNQESGWGH